MRRSGIFITEHGIHFTQAVIGGLNHPVRRKDFAVGHQNDMPGAIAGLLKEKRLRIDSLNLAIPRDQVSIRYLNLPTVEEKEIREMVACEVGTLFPLKPEEILYDYAVVKKNDQGYSTVMLIALQKEILNKQLETLRQAGLTPDTINISTISLFNQFCALYQDGRVYLLVHFEDSLLEILLVEKKQLLFSRGIRFHAGFEEHAVLEAVRLTTAVLADKGITIDQTVVSGPGAGLQEYADKFKGTIAKETCVETRIEIQGGLADAPFNVNLLPEELAANKKQLGLKKSLLFIVALCLINCILAGNIVMLKTRIREAYLLSLTSDIRKFEAPAASLKRKLAVIQPVKTYSNAGKLFLAVMSELYRRAPENITLDTLDMSNQKGEGSVTINGRAQDSGSVLRYANALKASSLIKKADVTYIKKPPVPAKEASVDFEVRAYY